MRFLTERYLYDLPNNKFKYENKINLDLLKKDTYHYFKEKDKVISEKKALEEKFQK